MPGHPDPRMNLALTLGKAGRTDDAIQTYKPALGVSPGHVPTEQALARLYVRSGSQPEDLDALLAAIAMQGETEEWREWARGRARERRRDPSR